MATPTNLGTTFWDVLTRFIPTTIPYVIIFALVFLIVWVIIHPEIAEKWNALITNWIAKYNPKKRKIAFEKNFKSTINDAISKSKKDLGDNYTKFLKPSELKVEWVNEDTVHESIFTDKQAIIYVNDHKNIEKQIVNVLSEYVRKSFIETSKYYLKPEYNNASDCIIVKKIIKYSRPNINHYFNDTYLPESFKVNPSYRIAYDKFKRIEEQGNFFPILIRELEKYTTKIYPSDSDNTVEKNILDFIEFIYRISTRIKSSTNNNRYTNGDIGISIIFAVSDYVEQSNDISKLLTLIKHDLEKTNINTIYILGSGRKTDYAHQIAQTVYKQNHNLLEEPIETKYSLNKTRAICIELNKINP